MVAVYMDTCMVIGLIEGDTEQRKILKSYLAAKNIFSSEMVRLEVSGLAILAEQM